MRDGMCVFVQVPARMKKELAEPAAATKGNLHIQNLGGGEETMSVRYHMYRI